MKKLTIIFYLFLIPLCVFAQNESSISHTKTVNDSTLIKIHAIVEDIDFRMHGLDRYKLYPTENIYNFLQLDIKVGFWAERTVNTGRKPSIKVNINFTIR